MDKPVAAGAGRASVGVVEIDEAPLTYFPSNEVLIWSEPEAGLSQV